VRDDPIILVGVNHSGTSYVSKMLARMGCFAGNFWLKPMRYEEHFHNRVHRMLVASEFYRMRGRFLGDQTWNGAVFDPDFVTRCGDGLNYFEFVKGYLEGLFGGECEGAQSWYWKCPTSALFMKLWKKVYPNARFVHLVRDGRDVACSLAKLRIGRKEIGRKVGFRLWNLYISKIDVELPEDSMVVRYERLATELPKIAVRFGLEYTPEVSASYRPRVGAWRKFQDDFTDVDESNLDKHGYPVRWSLV